MDRGLVTWVSLVLVGTLLVVTAPPDPQYSVSVYGPTDPPQSEPIVDFEDLSQEERDLFLDAFDDAKRFADPPDVQEVYVSYEGGTYQMAASAHEGPVLSLLMPAVGGVAILAGLLVAAYRYLSRSYFTSGAG